MTLLIIIYVIKIIITKIFVDYTCDSSDLIGTLKFLHYATSLITVFPYPSSSCEGGVLARLVKNIFLVHECIIECVYIQYVMVKGYEYISCSCISTIVCIYVQCSGKMVKNEFGGVNMKSFFTMKNCKKLY